MRAAAVRVCPGLVTAAAAWLGCGLDAWAAGARRWLASSEGRFGSTLVINGWQDLNIAPCAVAALELDAAAQQPAVGAAGASANVRLWFRQQRHRAPSSSFEFQGSDRSATADCGLGPVVRATVWL